MQKQSCRCRLVLLLLNLGVWHSSRIPLAPLVVAVARRNTSQYFLKRNEKTAGTPGPSYSKHSGDVTAPVCTRRKLWSLSRADIVD